MKQTTNKTLLALAISSAVCANAWALDPAAVKLGDGIAFTPTLKLSENYDDNFRAVETNEKSSWVTTIAPTLMLGAQGAKTGYSLSYTANHEIYHSSQKDTNTDHLLGADANFEFDARNRLRLNADYRKIEETSSDSRDAFGQLIQNDKYNTRSVGAGYTYGADSATGQIKLGANYNELRYDNTALNPNGSVLNADKERDATALSAAFLYRVGPKTRALIEGRHTDYEYVSNTQLDSTNVAVLVGAVWEATALTTGSVKIGRERKDFDSSGKDDRSGGMWEVGVKWEPLTYSSFSLNTRRALDEGSDNASAIRSVSTTLAWHHGWSERVSSEVSYTRSDQKYLEVARDDTLDTVGIGLTYKMRRWLDVGIGYKYSENDSTRVGKSYERNVYGITLNASL